MSGRDDSDTFGDAPASPSPAPRATLGGDLSFKPPARPGSSLRRTRKSAAELASPAPALPRSGTGMSGLTGTSSFVSALGAQEDQQPSRSSSRSSRRSASESEGSDEGLVASGTARAPLVSPTKPARPAARGSLALSTPLRAALGESANGASAAAPQGPTPRQTDRRARNAAAPAGHGDVGLLNELQENLVKEIRRLQGLLWERDSELKSLRENHDALNAQIERLKEEHEKVKGAKEEAEQEAQTWKTQGLQLIQNEDKLKQENWDLNVAHQQLESEVTERDAALKKVEAERNRLVKDLGKARDVAESQRVQLEEGGAELTKLRTLRETETAVARKEKAALTREMSDVKDKLTQAILEKTRAAERADISRSQSRSFLAAGASHAALGALADDDDDELSAEGAAARRRNAEAALPASPGGSTLDEHDAHNAHLSPLGNKLARDRDMADLRAKLAQAHKRSGKELLEKRKLRDANAELRALLQRAGVEAPEASDAESSEADEQELWIDEAGQPSRRGGKPRPGLPKSSTRPNIANRFGLGSRAGRRNSEEFNDDDEEDSLALAAGASGEDVDESMDSARRASLDGIDPAYADVTKPGFASPSAARSSRRTRRRDTVRPVEASPLARTVTLAGEEDEDDESASSTGHGAWGRTTNGRRSAAPGARSRPGSAIIEAGTLGNELEGLTGAPDDEAAREHAFAASGTYAGSALDLSRELGDARTHEAIMQTQPALDDKVMQTDAVPDTLTPLLAQRDAAHAVAVAAHAKALAQLGETHAASLEEREAAHQKALAEREANHARVLGDRTNAHTAALESREAEHEQALVAKEAQHGAALSAALAQQAKTHEAAVAEARSRHTKSLAEEVAKGAAAVAAAEAMHKKHVSDHLAAHQRAIERRDKQHADVLERQARQHAALLADKETANAAALEDMQMSNDAFIRDLENAFNQTLREREALITQSREEIEALRSRLSALENELERLRSESKAAEAAAAAASASRVALEQEAERLKAELEEARATIASNEHEDEFEDADEAPVPPSPRSHSGVDDNKTVVAAGAAAVGAAAAAAALAPSIDRSATRSTSSEVDSPPTPRDAVPAPVRVEEEGIRKVVLADLKDSGCQTDDDVWTRFQDAHRSAAAARTPAPTTDGVLIVGASGAAAAAAAAAAKPLRDSVSTFGGHRDGTLRPESPGPTMYTVSSLTRQQAAGSVRRPSVDSQLSGLRVETDTTTDHSKPPVMDVPPPPSMPPPAGLPTLTRRTSKQRTSTDPAPPRPISPPPPELLAMAQRRSSTLQVPAPGDAGTRSLGRAAGTSMPPPVSYPGTTAAGRQKPALRPRTISNEIVTGAQRGGDAASIRSQLQSVSSRRSDNRPPVSYPGNAHLRATSAASFASDATSDLSRRMSYASSRASDFAPPGVPATPGASTDPTVIHAITQTMIGEYLHKYTRKTMGRAGHSEKRHQRYFWLHPYTKMLYWTIADPGAQGVREGTSKSAVIEDVRVVEDFNNSPPGLYHLSIIVRTPARDMKLTAPNKERHDMWLSALGYLVSRSPPQGNASASEAIMAEASGLTEPASAGRQRTRTTGSTASRFLSPARSLASVARRNRSTDTFATNLEATPRPRGGSVGPASALNPAGNKRRDTAAHEYLNLWESRRSGLASPGPTSPRSIGTASRMSARSDYLMSPDDYEHVARPVDPRLQTAEQMLEEDEPEGFDGLENVRACCNGAHDVGDLAHKKYVSQQGGSTKRRGSIRSRHSRAGSNGSSASQLKQLRAAVKAGTGARPTSPPPQLGIMNLNAPRERDSKTSDTARSSTSDWFSPAEDVASLHGPPSGRTSAQGSTAGNANAGSSTRTAKSSSERSPMPPTTPTFGERRSAILKSRQSAA